MQSPQMIQAMQILQLSSIELEERIEQALIENPFLEVKEPEESVGKLEAMNNTPARYHSLGALAVEDRRIASFGEAVIAISQKMMGRLAGANRKEALTRCVAEMAPDELRQLLEQVTGEARKPVRVSEVAIHDAFESVLEQVLEAFSLKIAEPLGADRAMLVLLDEEPGELVRLECFYVGKLKGVGKVWQVTACDAASSYALARVFVQTQPTAETAARSLRHLLVPHYREARWPIQRLLTDRGSEFAGAFAKACQDLGIRHTQTKPRHAWTNGFVDRLQGTILHEHWRVEFRRRYFTQLPPLQRSLDSFLRFYNHERPHHGYRTRSRDPAAILLGAQAG